MSMHSAFGYAALLVATVFGAGAIASQAPGASGRAALQNPVSATTESLTAGKRAYDEYCAACHGDRAQGAERAGLAISIIEELDRKQPPDLTDERWDHGATDGEIFSVIKRGVPTTMMAGYDGLIPDAEIWSIVNYLRALHEHIEIAPTPEADAAAPRRRLELQEYARLPITGELDGVATRGQLARVNILRDEPGGRRFFVNDQNGPLYILDKDTRQFTTYLDFNGRDGRPGLFEKFTFERNFAMGLTAFIFDPD